MKKSKFFNKEFLFEKILFLLFSSVMLLILFSHTYNDILITTRHSMNFWRYLFSGDFFNFFKLNVCVTGNPAYPKLQRCAYNIIVYIIFAIWNIPLVLLENFAGVDVLNNVFCIVYSKLIVVAAMVISAIVLKKIVTSIGGNKTQQTLSLYLYLTSALMISTVFNIAQYDLLSVIFQLLGFYAFINKKNRQFLLWFSVAFCFKYFAVIIFLPLLVLRYKKIWEWLKALVLFVLPVLVTKLPFILFSTKSTNALVGEELSVSLGTMLFSNSFAVFNLFVICYICLLVFCYLREETNTLNDSFTAIWVCFIAYSAFCGFLKTCPYWTIFIAPFIVLIMLMAPKKLYITTILETAGLCALVVMNIFRFNWCYFGNTMKPMLMSLFLSDSTLNFKNSLICEIITKLSRMDMPLAIVTSIFVGCMIALAYITYPKKEIISLPQVNELRLDKDISIIRFLIICGICLLPMAALFI